MSLLVSKRLAWASEQTNTRSFPSSGTPKRFIQRKSPQCISAHLRGARAPQGAPIARQMGKQLGSIAALPAGRLSVEFNRTKTFYQNSGNLRTQLRSSVFHKPLTCIKFLKYFRPELLRRPQKPSPISTKFTLIQRKTSNKWTMM